MPSTMLRILSTSPPKSAWPGVSTKLNFVPWYLMAQFCGSGIEYERIELKHEMRPRSHLKRSVDLPSGSSPCPAFVACSPTHTIVFGASISPQEVEEPTVHAVTRATLLITKCLDVVEHMPLLTASAHHSRRRKNESNSAFFVVGKPSTHDSRQRVRNGKANGSARASDIQSLVKIRPQPDTPGSAGRRSDTFARMVIPRSRSWSLLSMTRIPI